MGVTYPNVACGIQIWCNFWAMVFEYDMWYLDILYLERYLNTYGVIQIPLCYFVSHIQIAMLRYPNTPPLEWHASEYNIIYLDTLCFHVFDLITPLLICVMYLDTPP